AQPPYGLQPPYGAQPPYVPNSSLRTHWLGRFEWRSKRAALVAGIAIAVVALAVALPLTLGGGAPPTPPLSPSALAGRTADQVNLHRADMPAGWAVDPSATGPLSGFLGTTGSAKSGKKARSTTTASTSNSSSALAPAVRAFKQCLGISPDQRTFLGGSGAPPLAKASSPAFAEQSAGSSTVEAGSTSTVFGSDAPVTSAVSIIKMPQFAGCFGTLVGQLLVVEGGSGSTKVTFGTPHVAPLPIPPTAGVTMAGVDVTVPVNGSTLHPPSVQLGVVLIGGGRIESTLFTFALGATFPVLLTMSLASTLAQREVIANTAVST
ncbi:MAG: hypothetical protein ACYDHU_08370, partial [Acidimicrobiales bacterium]